MRWSLTMAMWWGNSKHHRLFIFVVFERVYCIRAQAETCTRRITCDRVCRFGYGRGYHWFERKRCGHYFRVTWIGIAHVHCKKSFLIRRLHALILVACVFIRLKNDRCPQGLTFVWLDVSVLVAVIWLRSGWRVFFSSSLHSIIFKLDVTICRIYLLVSAPLMKYESKSKGNLKYSHVFI